MTGTYNKIALGEYQGAALLRIVTDDTDINLELLVDGKKEKINPAGLISKLMCQKHICYDWDVTIQINGVPATFSSTPILDSDWDDLTVTYALKNAKLAELRVSKPRADQPRHYTIVVKSQPKRRN